MSLHPEANGEIPELTRNVARASFPKPTPPMVLRDELGTLFSDPDFAGLYGTRGQPALSPWRLMVVTMLQFLENLTDRQAANAVRARIDWKYALGLELTNTGFDASVLSEFRTRLITGELEEFALTRLLEHCQARDLLRAGGKQRTDSTHVLAAVRQLNRLELFGETVRAALNELAVEDGPWLRTLARPEWLERYAHRVEDYRLPRSDQQRDAYLQQAAEDGLTLLRALEIHPRGTNLLALPRVKALKQVWDQQCSQQSGTIQPKPLDELASGAARIENPYDPEARFSIKRQTRWMGYKAHVSESCDDARPHLITSIVTTPATTADASMTRDILDHLDEQGLFPGEYLVDQGYTSASFLTEAAERGLDLVAPVRAGSNWQDRADHELQAFTTDAFELHWDEKYAMCPNGKRSRYWNPWSTKDKARINVRFHIADCSVCPLKVRCTRATHRGLTLLPQEIHDARLAARAYVQSEEYRRRYQRRAGIEATMSQGTRTFGLRRARYCGIEKLTFQHVMTAVAINLARLVDWWDQGSTQRPPRTRPAFQRLMQAA